MLSNGLTTVKLDPGNTATLKQFQEAITRNGFTMKQAQITVAGKLITDAGKQQLQVSGSNEIIALDPNGKKLQPLDGKDVVISGTVPPAQKGKAPDTIRVESIKEGQ